MVYVCIGIVASYVLGHDAMYKMGRSNVLISGMKGLGVEIGKYLKTSAQQRYNLKGILLWYTSALNPGQVIRVYKLSGCDPD